MNTLKMKIHSYDQSSNSLIVSFVSDVSTRDIDDCQKLAFQLHNDLGNTRDAVMKSIAQAGLSIANTQDKKDAMVENPTLIAPYTELVGHTLTYNVSDIDPTIINDPNVSPELVTVIV